MVQFFAFGPAEPESVEGAADVLELAFFHLHNWVVPLFLFFQESFSLSFGPFVGPPSPRSTSCPPTNRVGDAVAAVAIAVHDTAMAKMVKPVLQRARTLLLVHLARSFLAKNLPRSTTRNLIVEEDATHVEDAALRPLQLLVLSNLELLDRNILDPSPLDFLLLHKAEVPTSMVSLSVALLRCLEAALIAPTTLRHCLGETWPGQWTRIHCHRSNLLNSLVHVRMVLH